MGNKYPKNKIEKAVQKETVSTSTRNYRSLFIQGYVFLALSAFASLSVLANVFPYFKIDLLVSKSFQLLTNPYLGFLMQAVSWPGYSPTSGIITILIVIILFIVGLRWESVSVGINGIGILALSNIFKLIIQRSRPSSTLIHVLINFHDYSFPSGHVVNYTAFFGFLAFLSFVLLKKSPLRQILIGVLISLIILIGPSRIYLGEHWASDVLGGYLLGSLWLLASIYIYRWGKLRFFIKQPVAPKNS